MTEKCRRRGSFIYTLMFALVALSLCGIFSWKDRSFAYNFDGATQHMAALAYQGKYIREVLAGNGFKMVDFSLGQGFDVFTTLVYYGFTDPLNMVASLFPLDCIETVYAGLMIFKLYLSGLFAVILARYLRAEEWSSAIAGVCYAFCGFAIGGAMRHLNFGSGMIFLPLLLLGVERLMREKKWGVYVIAAALQLIVTFYFAYMNTVITVMYIAVRLIHRLCRKDAVSRCAKDGFALVGGYLLGAAISAAVLIPVAIVFLQGNRLEPSNVSKGQMLFYSSDYYENLMLKFFQYPQPLGYWSALGFIPLSAFSLANLFMKRRKECAEICWMILLCCGMMCVPLIGKVMNGMGYVSNRWCYALALFIALGTAFGSEVIFESFSRKWLPICLVVAVCAATGALVIRNFKIKVVLILFVITAGVLAVKNVWGERMSVKSVARGVLCALTVCSLMSYNILAFLPLNSGLMNAYYKWGVGSDALSNEMSVFSDSANEPFYRVGGFFLPHDLEKGYLDAYASILNYHGISHYWSLVPNVVSQHYIETQANTQPASYVLDGLGGDAANMLLASLKYLYVPAGVETPIMPGFEVISEGESGKILENGYALPLGYTYDSYVSMDEYERLSALGKREALLNAAVVEECVEGLMDSGSICERGLDFEIISDEANLGVKQLICDVPESGEVFLVFDGIQFAPGKNGTRTAFEVAGANGINRGYVNDAYSNWAYPQRGVVIPMGTYEAGEAEFVFEMGGDSVFVCEGIEVGFRASADYAAAAQKLSRNVLENVEIRTNSVAGTISLDERKWLQLSIPYSKGWSATVNGEEAELMRSGGMYMGLPLDAGEYEIELRYCTPYLKEGAVISAAALAVFVALMLAKRVRKVK